MSGVDYTIQRLNARAKRPRTPHGRSHGIAPAGYVVMAGRANTAHEPAWRRVRRWRSTARYQRMRGALLARSPWCADCLADGVYTPADELDHVRPAHLAADRFWDETNLQALCRWHHGIKTRAERAERLAKRREDRPRALRDWDALIGIP